MPPCSKAGGTLLQLVYPSAFHLLFSSQARRSLWFPTAAFWSGGVSRLTRLVLHSTPQSATVWIGRLPPPGRNRTATLRPHRSPCPIVGLYIFTMCFFFLSGARCYHLVVPLVTASGPGNRPTLVTQVAATTHVRYFIQHFMSRLYYGPRRRRRLVTCASGWGLGSGRFGERL